MDSDSNRDRSMSTGAPRQEIRLTAFENWINDNSASAGSISSRGSHSQPNSPAVYSRVKPSTPQPVPNYTLHNLPPPNIALSVIGAFYDYSGTMVFVIPREETLENYRLLYSTSSTVRDRQVLPLAEMCGILACGCDHASDVPDDFAKACRDTVKIMLDEITEQYELRGMRLFALCCMFSLLERPTAAWAYCGMCWIPIKRASL